VLLGSVKRVEAMVFPRREPSIAERNPARTPPDFAAIHEQLRGSKYVTLQLLWEEYRESIGPNTARLFERIMNERQTASGDGLARLPGDHPVGGQVLRAARGSSLGTSLAHRCVPLQERRIDLEKLARPSAASVATLRGLFAFGPECRSRSLRNQCSPSPESAR